MRKTLSDVVKSNFLLLLLDLSLFYPDLPVWHNFGFDSGSLGVKLLDIFIDSAFETAVEIRGRLEISFDRSAQLLDVLLDHVTLLSDFLMYVVELLDSLLRLLDKVSALDRCEVALHLLKHVLQLDQLIILGTGRSLALFDHFLFINNQMLQ